MTVPKSTTNEVKFVLSANARSAVKALTTVSETGDKTAASLKRNSQEESSSLQDVQKHTGFLRDSFGSLMGMVGIGGVAFGLKDLVQGGMLLQTEQEQLRNALQATGSEAAGATAQLEKMATTMSTTGGFSQTENLAALVKFVHETHSATKAQHLLALSSNIARATGQSLSETQQAVGAAYAGSGQALENLIGPIAKVREASIGLSVAHQRQLNAIANQSSMMGKMGGFYARNAALADHLTSREIGLAEVQNKLATGQQVLRAAGATFGSGMSNYMNTAAGRAQALHNAFTNLSQSVGLSLLPAVQAIMKPMAAIAGFMNKNRTIATALIGTVLALAAALAFRSVLGHVAALGNDFKKLGGKIVASMTKSAAVEAEFAATTTEGAAAVETLGTTAVVAGDEAGGAGIFATAGWMGFLTDTGLILIPVVLTAIITHFQFFKQIAIDAFNGIKSVAQDVIGWIVAHLKDLGNIVSNVFKDTPLGGIIGFGENLFSGHVGRAFGDLAQGATYGAFNAQNGSIGVPGRNVLPSSVQSHLGIRIEPAHATLRVDGRELGNAVVRYALNRAARGPTNAVGGSLMTGGPGLPVSVGG